MSRKVGPINRARLAEVSVEFLALSMGIVVILILALTALRRIDSFVSVTYAKPAPPWWWTFVTTPTPYLSAIALAVIVAVGEQLIRSRVGWGRRSLWREDSPVSFWSLLGGELALAAMFIHLSIHSAIGN